MSNSEVKGGIKEQASVRSTVLLGLLRRFEISSSSKRSSGGTGELMAICESSMLHEHLLCN